MKTKITLLALLITAFSFAQNGINYKAVIKDGLGNVLVNRDITMELNILKGAGWFNAYSESHNTTTDSNGIAIINIGEGTVAYGDPAFNTINWGSDDHFLNMKVNTGSVLTDLGTTQFKAVPYALSAAKAENVSGLEAIDEGNGIGWRLKGKNPAKYGNIGQYAVDLSDNFSFNSTTLGATGANAFATGLSTTASGKRSIALGNFTTASGDNSIAMGSSTVASKFAAFASGNSTSSTGKYTTAMGVGSTASGDAASAFGEVSLARGYVSAAFGSFTISGSYASMALGQYNIGLGNIYSWVNTDPVFEIGNGTSDAARSNLLTVLKNGNVGIGNHTPSSILEITHLDTLPTTANFRNALSIINKVSKESWQFHVDNGGTLLLYKKGAYRGYFNRATGAYVQASDARLKKDIVPLENNTLQKVMQLNPVSYQMKDQNDDERQIGLISQEVQKVFPSLTHLVPEKDILSLSYTEMIPILIKAIQEQQEVIKSMQLAVGSQQSMIKSQDTKIESLTAEVSELKSLVHYKHDHE